MTEDAFHLTSHDVRAQEFHKSLRGYDPVQVDDFKERIAQELDRMVRENIQLNERLKNLVEQLRTYRDRERAMNDALVAAQQLRTDSQSQADREAELIRERARAQADQLLLEARAEAQRMVEQARYDEQRLLTGNEAIRRQFVAYVASYRTLLERQFAEIGAIAASVEERTDTGAESEV